MTEMDPISEKKCSSVLIEYHMMDKVQNHGNPKNYMLTLSPFVKLGRIIKIAVPSTAKKAVPRQ
jgi:hypothetical protein